MGAAGQALRLVPPAGVLRVCRARYALVLLVAVLAFGLTRLLGPRQRFAAFTLPAVQDFSGKVDLKRWFTQAGIWSIRKEALVQAANLAKPVQIFIPQKLAADQPYHLSLYITLAKSTQGRGRGLQQPVP